MELSFREWIELEEAIRFSDIVAQIKSFLPRSWEELIFRFLGTQGLSKALQNRIIGLFNGVYMGKKPQSKKEDNPYNPEDREAYQGWIDGFNSARTGTGLLPEWFAQMFGIKWLQDFFKAYSGEEVA